MSSLCSTAHAPALFPIYAHSVMPHLPAVPAIKIYVAPYHPGMHDPSILQQPIACRSRAIDIENAHLLVSQRTSKDVRTGIGDTQHRVFRGKGPYQGTRASHWFQISLRVFPSVVQFIAGASVSEGLAG